MGFALAVVAAAELSPRLWSLWPQIHNVAMDFGVDYWEDMLIPLDNYISKGTATFVNSTNPNYQDSLYQMVEHTLSGVHSHCDCGWCCCLDAVFVQWLPLLAVGYAGRCWLQDTEVLSRHRLAHIVSTGYQEGNFDEALDSPDCNPLLWCVVSQAILTS